MPLDSHSLCPCGSGKEIRFCCSEMLKDFQQLETMLSNGQFSASLAMIEKLEEKHPNNAALMAAKCLIFRETGRFEEFFAAAGQFYGAYPQNVKAIAENTFARTLAGENAEALSSLIDGIEKNEPGKIDGNLLGPLALLVTNLLDTGQIYPAVALAKLLRSFNPKSREAAALLGQIYRSKEIPLIEKEITFDPAAPDDFPFRDKYADAAVRLATGHWKEGKALLEELLSCAGQWPNLHRSLGLVHFWFGDLDEAADAMKKFAASERVPFDDAVDALSAAMMLRRPLSDDTAVIQVVRTVPDPDKAIELLLSSPRVISMPFDPHQFTAGGQPAPSHAFRVIDRPFPEQGSPVTVENTPVTLGTFLFFGRQTDREARIEIQIFEPDKEKMISFLESVLGGNLGPETGSMTLSTLPWLFNRLGPDFQFKAGAAVKPEEVAALYRSYFEEVLAGQWLSHPNDYLGGKTPAELAGQPESARTLAALVQTVAFQTDPQFADGLAAVLRGRLGIPQPEPIVPPEGTDSEVLAFFQNTPIWRWNRADLSHVSAAACGQLLQVISLFEEESTMARLSERILSLPADEKDAQARYLAYRVKIGIVEASEGPARALELIPEAKNAARQAGISEASLELREAAIHLLLGRAELFQQTITSFAARHRNEPEAMAELQMLLMNLGILNPDGTPRAAGPAGGAEAPAPAPSEPKLWTPDSELPPSGGGSSKLWTPD